MNILRVAETKRKSWFHRLYLVFEVTIAGLGLLGITDLWLSKYFDSSTFPEWWLFPLLSVGLLVPAGLLWLGYRLVLFICFGRAAFS